MTGDLIFHITQRASWTAAQAAGEYVAESLASEGFIHASGREQVVETADRFYAGQDGLVLLCIDPGRLTAPLKFEAPVHAGDRNGQLFPHIYGPLNLDAVLSVLDFPCDADGRFEFPQESPRQITVCATNFDGSPHWQHAAWLLRAEDGFVQTGTPPNTPVKTEGDGYVSPFDTRGHYWTDRWFNVIRLETPGEGLYGYYCNIATPLQFDGETVRYVDLQIDVRVFAEAGGNLTYRIVDEDEFEAARQRYAYNEGLVSRCYAAVDELVRMVEAREFPFDG